MALRVHPTSLTRAVLLPYHCSRSSLSNIPHFQTLGLKRRSFRSRRLKALPRRSRSPTITAALPPLDLTEDNIRQVLIDARSELAQIFDSSVGITGEVDLADLDGPFVKLRLKGRFWHQRAIVLARLGNYLKNRIPEILEVDIEDEKQLDDSPENF
ncbi:uncharacterized protein [Elaeis guineensis]|uniref:Uncharacterized protein LOC105050026 isoform X1 n=1 Tax=Elaeis guineensis var. tenera TaxID=51953 RepID=A0A6I9RLD6_ELAGV|nr:uncharacterized protein LOC105050026 isoform X1 [Elaeis guineensis]XP_010928170.1 uncharacterized protein LOC105050026 isoform X1 [Elaeis guineensis]XP_010928171.1 uncharacterized protein LOC105050026 isoform X1 [Elaeis guineensis]XP_010928172.1 uncharacterized protein LOC105050026 isoform X1 [Elaeis guineensis]XP_029121934.1 uncharacterized protein LOC105050026 isoform X1 [Elaeis guineensis]